MRSVAILIPCTRSEFLWEKLLPEVLVQLDSLDSTAWEYKIFVCFNGPASHSENSKLGFSDKVEQLRTPLSGFAIPRNILWNASKSFDSVIYLDDDQLPEAQWLHEFAIVIENPRDFDVYFGGVNYLPIAELPRSKRSLTPRSRNRIYGEVTDPYWGGIGNTLIIRNSRTNFESPFNEEFNWGGEDLAFFLTLRDRGCRFYSIPDANVNELWDSSRVTILTVLKRMNRQIGAYYRIRLFQKKSNGSFDKNWPKIYGRLFIFTILLPLFVTAMIISLITPSSHLRNSIQLRLGKIVLVVLNPWMKLFAFVWKKI
jgi:hypothetical protein